MIYQTAFLCGFLPPSGLFTCCAVSLGCFFPRSAWSLPSHPPVCCALCLVTQSCLTLSNPMDYSPPGSSVHADPPGKNTGVGCYALLRGIFPNQRSHTGLPYCRRVPCPPNLCSNAISSEEPFLVTGVLYMAFLPQLQSSFPSRFLPHRTYPLSSVQSLSCVQLFVTP